MIRNEKDADLLNRLRGNTVALGTPLKHGGQLDREALAGLIERTIRDGVAGLFPLGWMGEQPSLTTDLRHEVMETVVRQVNGRVPVIVGISEQSLPRALKEAKVAEKVGADVVLATPPYSYQISHEVVIDFFAQLSPHCSLPVILYNNAETNLVLSVEEVKEVSQIPGMIGVKDYSDFVQLERLIANVQRDGEFVVWVADEYVLSAAILMGATHSILGGPGNIAPDWGVQLHQLAEDAKWDEVAKLQNKMNAFCDKLYALAPNTTAYSTIKSAMAILGCGSGWIVPPQPTLTPAQVGAVHRVLEEYDVTRPLS